MSSFQIRAFVVFLSIGEKTKAFMNMLEREFLDEAKDLSSVSCILFIFALSSSILKKFFQVYGLKFS